MKAVLLGLLIASLSPSATPCPPRAECVTLDKPFWIATFGVNADIAAVYRGAVKLERSAFKVTKNVPSLGPYQVVVNVQKATFEPETFVLVYK